MRASEGPRRAVDPTDRQSGQYAPNDDEDGGKVGGVGGTGAERVLGKLRAGDSGNQHLCDPTTSVAEVIGSIRR